MHDLKITLNCTSIFLDFLASYAIFSSFCGLQVSFSGCKRLCNFFSDLATTRCRLEQVKEGAIE